MESFTLKTGPSSADNFYGVCCEGRRRRGCCAHCMAHASSDVGPEQNLHSCIFEMLVDRMRRAGYPKATAHKQWAQEEGSTHIMKLWIHSTTMRDIRDKYRNNKPISGWYKAWNRTVRLRIAAIAFPVAFPSVHAYQGDEIDDLDLKLASWSTLPKRVPKKKRWIPQWTIPSVVQLGARSALASSTCQPSPSRRTS